jgi:hypothetical protein
MALDFNLLRPAGGSNPVNAFFQGQQATMDREAAQQNALLAREKMAQDQEFNALRRQQLTGQIAEQERTAKSQAAAQKTGLFRERLLRARTPEDARNLVRMQYADPDLAPILSQAASVEQALAEISDDPTEFEKYRQQEAMGMAEWIKSQTPKVTPTGDVYDPAKREFIRKPQAAPAPVRQPPMVEEFTFARSPEGGGFTGSYQDFVIAREAAKRPPPAPRVSGGGGMPKAPPGYRFTPTGDLEAIPGGPAAAKLGEATAKKDEGMTQASNILDSLEAAYTDLEARKAIPSEKRNAVANTLASISASAPGQIAERTIGTKAQTQRDVIASSRLQLLNAIKGATGMSSQQLNSNVELTTWLNSLTDPSRSIETNREILQNVRRFIDSGGTYTAKQGGKPAPAAGASNIAQERANASAAIAAGAPAAAVRERFKQNTGQEL